MIDLTWKGYSILSSVELDRMIAYCDLFEPTSSDDAELVNMPFTVWQPQKYQGLRMLSTATLQLPRAPSTNKLDSDTDYRLFNHYISHIASLMMPFENARNPWKTLYPAIAMQQQCCEKKAMINAMMSQAAFNLAHLGRDTPRMISLGRKYSQASVGELSSYASKVSDCGELIATVLTMMMAEVINIFFATILDIVTEVSRSTVDKTKLGESIFEGRGTTSWNFMGAAL